MKIVSKINFFGYQNVQNIHDYGFDIFFANGPISFVAKVLKVVAWSSCEAEYAASAYCTKEIAFVRQLLLFLGIDLHGPIIFGVDNTASIDAAENLGVTARTKHFKQATHYLRDEVEHKEVKLVHIPTYLQWADWFTKVLDKTTFLRNLDHFLHDYPLDIPS